MVCKNLKFTVQGVEFQQNFFIMELGGTELMLELDWLPSLGNIEANFRKLCFRCHKGSLRGVSKTMLLP